MENEDKFFNILIGVITFETTAEFVKYHSNKYNTLDSLSGDGYSPFNKEHIVINSINFDSRTYSDSPIEKLYFLVDEFSKRIELRQKFTQHEDIWYSFETRDNAKNKSGIQIYKLKRISSMKIGWIYGKPR